MCLFFFFVFFNFLQAISNTDNAQTLTTRPCEKCSKAVYEASLQCKSCQSTSEPCIVTGTVSAAASAITSAPSSSPLLSISVFVTGLLVTVDQYVHVCMYVCVHRAGYPIPKGKRIACKSCKMPAAKDDWNTFVVKCRTCPWCGTVANAQY